MLQDSHSKISVIIATLLRPSLQDLLDSLRAQTLSRDYWELVTLGPQGGEINEYQARNWAVKKMSGGEILCFLDDDTRVPENYLERGLAHFEQEEDKKKLQVLDCDIEGDMWAQGKRMRLDKEMLGVGAALWARREAFETVGGFEIT